jgi:hypothetical protein
MTDRRLPALAVALVVAVSACGGSLSDSASPDDENRDVELVSPTEVDRAFDLTGGATRSSEDVTVVDDDPKAALTSGVRDATEPWDTDWSRRTVDLGEFLAGIPAVDPRDRIPPIDAIRLQKPLTPVAGAFSFSSPAREDFALREGASPPHSG